MMLDIRADIFKVDQWNSHYILRFMLDGGEEIFKLPIVINIEGQQIVSPLTDRWIQELINDLIREIYKSDLMGERITLDQKKWLYDLVCEILGVAR